ncbi:hypothetical protein M5K25_010569 [Dendrobium thyrsiflorum]|uniref:Uncharacterized protein n=1 Tax=Dendrobium thyrsiflorum TaxID=117978 RepID=A0ABD0V0T3_DENTH
MFLRKDYQIYCYKGFDKDYFPTASPSSSFSAVESTPPCYFSFPKLLRRRRHHRLPLRARNCFASTPYPQVFPHRLSAVRR